MMKLVITLLTDPLELPAYDLWALGILAVVGAVVFFAGCQVSPRSGKDAFLYWAIRLGLLAAAFGTLCLAIAAVKWIAGNFLQVVTVTAVAVLFIAAVQNIRRGICRGSQRSAR